MVPVGGQHRVVVGHLLLFPGSAAGLDQGPAADRDPAVLGEPRADRAAREVGLRRGLLPPARGNELVQPAGAPFDPVLRLAVLEHLHVGLWRVGQQEPGGGIVLRVAAVEQQRVDAVAAEADVGEPGPAPVGRADDQGQMIERRPEPGLAVHTRRDPRDLGAQGLQQQRERPVELVAEAPPAPGHDLVEQGAGVQRDRLRQVNAEVLERHGHLVGAVQGAQRRGVGPARTRGTDAAQVRG